MGSVKKKKTLITYLHTCQIVSDRLWKSYRDGYRDDPEYVKGHFVLIGISPALSQGRDGFVGFVEVQKG